jgi:hypothetical protein
VIPALTIEEWRTDAGVLVGWRLLLGAGDVYLVFDDQKQMPGVRLGESFKDAARALRSREVFVGGDTRSLLEELRATQAERDELRMRVRAGQAAASNPTCGPQISDALAAPAPAGAAGGT